LGDDVQTSEAEVWCGGEEVAVVGVNFGEPMLDGTGQVERVGGAEEAITAPFQIKPFGSFHDGSIKSQPLNSTGPRVIAQLGINLADNRRVGRLLPQLAVANGDKLQASMSAAGNVLKISAQGGHFQGARFVPMKLGK